MHNLNIEYQLHSPSTNSFNFIYFLNFLTMYPCMAFPKSGKIWYNIIVHSQLRPLVLQSLLVRVLNFLSGYYKIQPRSICYVLCDIFFFAYIIIQLLSVWFLLDFLRTRETFWVVLFNSTLLKCPKRFNIIFRYFQIISVGAS